MKITIRVIKAGIGSIGCHIRLSRLRPDAVREHVSSHASR